MTQYIDKDKVLTEIERKIRTEQGYSSGDAECGYLDCAREILSFLATLEVKEVDLEKYYHDFLQKEWFDKNCCRTISEMMAFTAKHFFELGLQVNNPITAADRGMAEEIIINLKRVEQDYHLDLTREMEWLRNKAQKGE